MKPRHAPNRYYVAGFQGASRYDSERYAWSEADAYAKTHDVKVRVFRVDVLETWTPVRRPRIKRKR